MILRPMIPFVVLAAAGLAVFALCLHAATQQPRLAHQQRRWLLRASVFALLLVALMRPSFSGAAPPAQLIEKADIFLVIDRSGSMSAEDFDQGRPRIEGVRTHLTRLAQASSGARFSVVGFGSKSHIMLPLTDNTEALVSALEALNVEPTLGARGTSISAAKPVLEKLLKRSKARDGRERRRFVVYVGDGEQTADAPVESFSDLRPLIDGGLVLGYGTSEGARMRETSTILDSSETPFVAGPDGAPAVSKINERNLEQIAADLGATYQHMAAGTDIGRLSAKLRGAMSTAATRDSTPSYHETYWLPMGAVALIMALELGLVSRRQAAARGRRRDAAV